MREQPIQQLDQRIRQLNLELEGVAGAVLREVDPQRYAEKHAELQQAVRDYYQLLYGDSVSMP